MVLEKKCTKCKEELPIGKFYKNKLTQDGHSIYCVDCTKVNSKKYFEKKKVKTSKVENENLMKSVLLNKFNGKLNEEEINQLMRIMLIEKMVNTIVEELVPLKQHYVKSNNLIETGL
jgi:hypothetical protein